MVGVSVIVCSRTEEANNLLISNIEETIGCALEIITINNSLNQYSIFEAYNKGIKDSIFPILLFVHEDVLFHTFNWGTILLEYFTDPSLGLLGIAGSKIKTTVPSGWWNNRSEHILMNIIQSSGPLSNQEKITFGFKEKNLEEVVVIDGVFMAARKDTRIKFNEELGGFHNYDQSISLEYRKNGYKVAVTKEIILEHFSKGNKDSQWIDSLEQFQKLYQNDLPQAVEGIVITNEDKAFSYLRFVYNCRNNNRKMKAFTYWLQYLRLKPFNKINISFVKYFLKLNSST